MAMRINDDHLIDPRPVYVKGDGMKRVGEGDETNDLNPDPDPGPGI